MAWVKDFLRTLTREDASSERYVLDIDQDGINLVLPMNSFEACQEGQGSVWALHQHVFLQMLEEQGLAERILNGFSIPAGSVAGIDEEALKLLGLPHRFPGHYKTRIRGQAGGAGFTVQIIPTLADGTEVPAWKLRGACLQLATGEHYLLQAAEIQAFRALLNHNQIPDDARSEQLDLKLIGALQGAKEAGMVIDLEHFNRLDVTEPERIGVAARETEDGGLLLTPTFGIGVDPKDIDDRLGQIPLASEIATMRVLDHIVLLDEERLKAAHEILTNRVIPRDQVKAFMESPGAFLDAALVDLDIGFSLCVKGATRFTHIPIGETDVTGIDWFSGVGHEDTPDILHQLLGTTEELEAFKTAFALASVQGAQSLVYSGHQIDVSEPDEVNRVITEIDKRLKLHTEPVSPTHPVGTDDLSAERATVLVEEEETDLVSNLGVEYSGSLDFSVYRRAPYPYQEEGVRWLLGLAEKAMGESENASDRIHGALLADDMGLGKTYMALVGINEIYANLQQKGKTAKPVLVVAPLGLLENWEEEIEKTFTKSPFDDVVVLQAGRDLPRFRIHGASSETRQNLQGREVLEEDAIRYSLKTGSVFMLDRLDIPNRLVLTTYQTLRDYQFSLCRVGWSVVVFDEAQNLKNPNVLQTRAARGLKADFKLLITGTPVENSLVDFWCLMRIAQPGLLGEIDEFRAAYIRPIKQAEPEAEDTARLAVGKRLRNAVGAFMLRRMKEDHLDGLPAKRVYCGVDGDADHRTFCPPIGTKMSGAQLDRYDAVIESYYQQAGSGGRGQALATLQHLRDVSLHPELYEGEFVTPQDPSDTLAFLQQSAKITGAMTLIDEIRDRQEKVIIFLINKRLQRLLKIALESHYGVSVSIINGDTKAVASRGNTDTRKGLLGRFEAKPGFGIILMSPIAAGVGLTVVGANNVIHLERHWNPAKEAQATDRVYRIGQERDVNVYLPILHHPEQVSFDLNLDRLLQRKSGLKDAVVTPQSIRPTEMREIFPDDVRDEYLRDTGAKLSYKQYLRSSFWKALRAEAIRAAEGKCEFCESTKALQVHHKRYPADFQHDSLDNLVVVCANHHKTLHGLQVCDMCHEWAVLDTWQPKPPREMARNGVVPLLNLCQGCMATAAMEGQQDQLV
jgi:SNF2 family DNA or RNA helicase